MPKTNLAQFPALFIVVIFCILLGPAASFVAGQKNINGPQIGMPDRLFGLTIDETTFQTQGRREEIITQLQDFKQKFPARLTPTVRIVLPVVCGKKDCDSNALPDDYIDIIQRISTGKLAVIMAELMDSDAKMSSFCFNGLNETESVNCYQNRAAAMYSRIGKFVDIWEIGNEINGDWFGGKRKLSFQRSAERKTVVKQIAGAYSYFEKVKTAAVLANASQTEQQKVPRTAVTYYFNDDGIENCAEGRHSYECKGDEPQYGMGKWIKEGGAKWHNIDYILISYYPDNNFYTLKENDKDHYNPKTPDKEIPLELSAKEWVKLFSDSKLLYGDKTKFGIGESGTNRSFAECQDKSSCEPINVNYTCKRSGGCCLDTQVKVIQDDYVRLDNEIRAEITSGKNLLDTDFVGGYFYWHYSPDVINKLTDGTDDERTQADATNQAIINAYRSWIEPSLPTGVNFGGGLNSIRDGNTADGFRTIQTGDTTKPNPYTILIVSNPAFYKKRALTSQKIHRDPINDDEGKFNASVDYIYANLFASDPRQHERLLAEPSIKNKIRVVSVWTNDLPTDDADTLIEIKGQFVGRRAILPNFITKLNSRFPKLHVDPDVVFAITGASNGDELQPTGMWALDDESRGGVPFTFDGNSYLHCYYSKEPGIVAFHADDRDLLTPLHEFSHAASGTPNGFVADLYNDNDNDLTTLIINKKIGDTYIKSPPKLFATYNGILYYSDPYRDDEARDTIHPEPIDSSHRVLMDNYTGDPLNSQHDKLTRQFLLDRITVKVNRPPTPAP
jgi:hypothetical protein